MHKVIFTFEDVPSKDVVKLVDAITNEAVSLSKVFERRVKMHVQLSNEEPSVSPPNESTPFTRYMTSTTPEGRDKNG